MKMQRKNRWFVFLFGMIFCSSIYSNEPLHRIQSVYLFNFFKYITWQNESEITTFKLAVVGDEPNLLIELKAAAKSIKPRNRQVVVEAVTDLNKLTDFHLVFVAKNKILLFDDIASITRRSNTLLVTQSLNDSHNLMINLRTNANGTIHFEVNKSNIVYEGLQMAKEMLLLGGSELDVAMLLRDTEDILLRQKQNLEEKGLQLKSLQQSMKQQQDALEKVQQAYQQQQSAYDLQSKQVIKSARELKQLRLQAQEQLTDNISALNKQQILVETKEQQMSQLSLHIATNQQRLNRQKQELNQLEQALVGKQQLVTELGQTVEQQQLWIWLLGAAGILATTLVVIILLLTQSRSRTNRQLKEKNANLLSTQQQLKLAKEEAENAKIYADQANSSKSEFLANMSHELRTPLNAVLGFSEILSKQIVDPKQKTFINNINSAGTTLLSLINSVLDLARIEAGKIELELVPTSIRKLFSETTSVFAGMIEQKNVAFIEKVDSSVPDYLLLDTNRLREILLNLCSNAFKFTREGQVSIRAEAINKSEDTGLLDLKLHIVDTGKGIAKDDFDRIFRPFVQSDGQKVSDYGGTGLGLTIARKFIEMMAGTIELESELGKGSHFIINLHGVEVAPNYSHEDERLKPHYEAIDFAPAKLLVVDDIALNREVIINYLEHWPFTISQADNGLEALELCKSEQFDLILMDMKMPVMDGYEASKQLKSNPETADIPIIAITAYALKHEAVKSLEQCDMYLAKPLLKTLLVESLMKVLKHGQDKAILTTSTELQVIEQSSETDLVTRSKEGKEENNKTILVVDDDEFNRMLFREILEDTGYGVIEAYDGVEGLKLINKYQPDLILLDQNMPNMNGLELLRQLNNTKRPLPNVVLISADDCSKLGNKFIELGVCGIVSKPVNRILLLEKISEIFVNH